MAYIECTEGVGKKVATHTITEGGETLHLERDQPGVGITALPESPQISAVSSLDLYPTEAMDIQGKWFLTFKITFSTNTDTATVKLAFYDLNGAFLGYSELISITNIGESESGRYVGDTIVYTNDWGAKSVKVALKSITGGNITISMGAI